MAQTVQDLIGDILRREGGYVNHPNDRGGPTNRGITQATLSTWLGRPATIAEVQQLDEDTARHIYETTYFTGPRLDRLPRVVQAQVMDCAVNMGPKPAIKLVQAVINAAGFGPVDHDGVLGPQTIRAAESAATGMGPLFGDAIAIERIAFYRDVVRRRPDQAVFLGGWTNRACEFASPKARARITKEAA